MHNLRFKKKTRPRFCNTSYTRSRGITPILRFILMIIFFSYIEEKKKNPERCKKIEFIYS
jgi:hypothetical protein